MYISTSSPSIKLLHAFHYVLFSFFFARELEIRNHWGKSDWGLNWRCSTFCNCFYCLLEIPTGGCRIWSVVLLLLDLYAFFLRLLIPFFRGWNWRLEKITCIPCFFHLKLKTWSKADIQLFLFEIVFPYNELCLVLIPVVRTEGHKFILLRATLVK